MKNTAYNNSSLVIALVLTFIAMAVSGGIFINLLEHRGTELHWKFFCSLAGFTIFFIMFCCIVAGSIIAIKNKKTL